MVAPVFFSGAIYAILSILISANGRQYAPISPHLILTTFITYDVAATIVRVIGAASIRIAESKQKDPATANNIFLVFLDLPRFTEFLPASGAKSAAQEHELGFHRGVCSGDIANISAGMFQASGDGRKTS